MQEISSNLQKESFKLEEEMFTKEEIIKKLDIDIQNFNEEKYMMNSILENKINNNSGSPAKK
jgi:hypothetical protein